MQGRKVRTERKDIMTFVYPAVLRLRKMEKGYDAYFPDLECCEAEGPDLEDAVENAREAAYNWISPGWRKRAICRHRRISMI